MQSHSQKIDDKLKQLEAAADKLRIEAKDYLAKSQAVKGGQREMFKQKALFALNKKKQIQGQMSALMNQQMTLQKINMTSESIKNHAEMYNAMNHAITQQKKAMKNVDADKLADLQDEMLDMKFQAQYMNEIMNRNYELDVDEAEIDDELAEFEREIAMDKKKAVNTNTNINASKNTQQANYKNQDIYSAMKGL